MPAVSWANTRADGKKKIGHSMSGNRTRGVCVTGRNVTNYTNTDLFVVGKSKHWLLHSSLMSAEVTYYWKTTISSFDHTTVDIPHPIRTAKSSTVGPDQYCGGGPRGNLGCRMFFLNPTIFLLNPFFFYVVVVPKFFFYVVVVPNFFFYVVVVPKFFFNVVVVEPIFFLCCCWTNFFWHVSNACRTHLPTEKKKKNKPANQG